MAQKKYVSLARLSNFLDNLNSKFSALSHKHTISDISDYTVDTELSSASNNPVANSTLNDEFDAISEAMNVLETVIDGKADSTHTHSISNITDLQTTLDAKVPTSRTINNKALTSDIALSASDVGADASGSANAVQTNLDTHTSNADIHFTEAERTKLSGIETGAQVNTVTGVKGNSESSYRTGNINITKANIGLGNVDNTADSAKSVNYATSAGSATKATQDASGNVITSTYETKTDASAKLTESKSYTDTAIANLVNGAPETLNTLDEIAAALDDNADIVEVLNNAISTKANASDLNSHTTNTSNPHGVTLAQLGVTATTTELNYMDGVTSNVQTQLDSKSSVIIREW